MKAAARDRGAVLDFAGLHHLSPGLRDGRPALLHEGETAGRCGWAAFFEALGLTKTPIPIVSPIKIRGHDSAPRESQ